MKFPDWAPTVLVEWYLKQENGDNEDSIFSKNSLEKLLTANEMESVWKALSKRINDSSDYIEFLEEVEYASWPPSEWDSLTESEKTAWVKAISKKAKELAELFIKYDDLFEFNAYSFINDDHATFILESIRGKYPQMIKDAASGWEDEMTQSELIECVMRNLVGYVSMWDHLEDISEKIENKIETFEKLRGRADILVRPNIRNARMLIFFRGLGSYIEKKYGTPLHDVIANTACVLFDDPTIDTDRVRFATNPIRGKTIG